MADVEVKKFSMGLGGVIMYFAYVLTSLAEILLGIRVLLKLFGASTSAPFTDFIYRTTADLLYPFRGIFATQAIGNGFVLDVPAIFAIFMYLIALYLIETIISFFEARRA